MKRLVVLGAVAAAALVPASALASTMPPDDTTPATSEATATEATESTTDTGVETTMAASESTMGDDSGASSEPGTIYDDSGNAVAAVTAGEAESAWGEYEEGNDPEAGREYLRMTVTVESLISDGTFGISVGDFILQDNNGSITTAENVKTADEAEAGDDITEEADLGNGESVELTLTFEVVSSVGPQSVFYRPDDDRMVDIAEFA